MSESTCWRFSRRFSGPPNTATPEQVLAWEDFFHKNDPLIRARRSGIPPPWADIDDLSQEVWKTVVRRLLGLRLDRIRGTLRDWIAGVCAVSPAGGRGAGRGVTTSSLPGIGRPASRSGRRPRGRVPAGGRARAHQGHPHDVGAGYPR